MWSERHSPFLRDFELLAQDWPHLVRLFLPERIRWCLVHVQVLHHFQLYRMDAIARPPESPRDVAALEAAIEHRGVAGVALQRGEQPARQAGIAQVVVDSGFTTQVDSPADWATLPDQLAPLLQAV